MKSNRRFLPGSEWAYIKVYSGPKFLDEFLVSDVFQIAYDLYAAKKVDLFFFVRFVDVEGHHLRLRFHFVGKGYLEELLQIFSERLLPYVESHVVTRMCMDTYVREVERYGGETTIMAVETIFSANSIAILNELRALAAQGKSEDRWLLGMLMTNDLMNSFGLSIDDKIDISETYLSQFLAEFDATGNKPLKAIIQAKFREKRSQIESAMLSTNPNLHGGILPDKDAFQQAIGLIRDKHSRNKLSMSFDRLLMSILHMNYNRIFRTKPRMNEMIAHSLASNFYRSFKARSIKEGLKGRMV